MAQGMGRGAWTWAFALGLGLASMQVRADPFDDARTLIRRHMADNDVPGMAVAVWQDGRIVWEQGFGWADRERRVAADENTPFSLASLSKTLTAVGVMTLVEAGRIDLDAPANGYLGDDAITSRAGDPEAVTVRRLLKHTSGMAPGDRVFYGEAAAGIPSLGETIRRYGIVVAPPGERWVYSNLGYDILGRLIEQVSGRSYADYMRTRVFLPLGMGRSSVEVAEDLQPFRAARYAFDGSPVLSVSSGLAAGEIYASAHDLARFGLFFLKQRLPGQVPVLSDAGIDLMTRDVARRKGRPAEVPGNRDGYALGWQVRHEGGHRLVGHSGSMSGVSSEFLLVPEANLGVALLANVDGGAPSGLAKRILHSALPGYVPAPPAKRPAPAAFAPPPALVGTWHGEVHTHEGPQPIDLRVPASGDIRVRIGGEPRFGAGRSTYSQDALLNEAAFDQGELTGTTLARLETSDTRRGPYTVSLRLMLRGDTLDGVALAESVYDGLWREALPHWAELRRVPAGGR